MGYDIYIGNTIMEPVEQYEDEEEYTTPYQRIIDGRVIYFRPVVKRTKHPDAPTFPGDEITGNGNSRHPGYISWGNFCTETGLEDLFFHRETGLMREHPGHFAFTEEHVQIVKKALERFKALHPQAIPRFTSSIEATIEVTREDAHLARLIWLHWWMEWTLNNCEHAAIYNS